jgi:hypothetical protein
MRGHTWMCHDTINYTARVHVSGVLNEGSYHRSCACDNQLQSVMGENAVVQGAHAISVCTCGRYSGQCRRVLPFFLSGRKQALPCWHRLLSEVVVVDCILHCRSKLLVSAIWLLLCFVDGSNHLVTCGRKASCVQELHGGAVLKDRSSRAQGNDEVIERQVDFQVGHLSMPCTAPASRWRPPLHHTSTIIQAVLRYATYRGCGNIWT